MTPTDILVPAALLPFAGILIYIAERFKVMDAPDPLRWADATERFPLDVALREAGWVIHSRPRKGDAIWEHMAGGVVCDFATAVKTLGKLERLKRESIAQRHHG